MKKLVFHSVFFLTCFYFLSAGNLTFFSKLAKTDQTEICDLDEDASDAEGKEGKDSKEDGSGEELFIQLLAEACLPACNELQTLHFTDLHLFLPQSHIEKIAPPPRA